MQREMRAVAAATSANRPSQEVEHQAEKYLTFRVGTDVFAVSFGRVREIMGVQKITAVPASPVFVKGTINLRGKIVPVVDLRLKLGLPEREYKLRTCIVVVQIEAAQIEAPAAEKVTIGIIVDSVAEVLALRPHEIQNGIAKVQGKVKTMLDLDRLLSTEEMNHLIAVCY
jgi:purine-binding chemotaxis protein CheW